MLSHILLEGNALNDLTAKIMGYVPLIVVAMIIFALSSMSNHAELTGLKSAFSDYVWHGIGFFGFALCSVYGAYFRIGDLTKAVIIEAGSVTLLFAFLDEFHQSFVPYRDPSIGDVLADIVGGAVGIALFSLAVRYKKTSETEGESEA